MKKSHPRPEGGSTWSTWLGDIRSRMAISDVYSVDGHHHHRHVLELTLLLFTRPLVLATLSASMTTDLGSATTTPAALKAARCL